MSEKDKKTIVINMSKWSISINSVFNFMWSKSNWSRKKGENLFTLHQIFVLISFGLISIGMVLYRERFGDYREIFGDPDDLLHVMVYLGSHLIISCLLIIPSYYLYFKLESISDEKEIEYYTKHGIMQEEFNSKYNALIDLYNKGVLEKREFKSKSLSLMREYRLIYGEQEKIKRHHEKIKSLDKALASGVMTEKEYKSKMKSIEIE